jgi:hypothetical protein
MEQECPWSEKRRLADTVNPKGSPPTRARSNLDVCLRNSDGMHPVRDLDSTTYVAAIENAEEFGSGFT